MRTRVILNRCIGKIIARDLSLMASRLYRMAVTWPQLCVAVTLSPTLGADLLGCINRTREMQRKDKEELYIPAAYVLVRNHKSRYRLVQRNANLSADLVNGETPHPLSCGKYQCRCHLYRAEIQRREEAKRETRKHPKVIQCSISQLPNPCSHDHRSHSSYLGVGLCWNYQGRASAPHLASMTASAAVISRSHR
jgi:hypothetical protein